MCFGRRNYNGEMLMKFLNFGKIGEKMKNFLILVRRMLFSLRTPLSLDSSGSRKRLRAPLRGWVLLCRHRMKAPSNVGSMPAGAILISLILSIGMFSGCGKQEPVPQEGIFVVWKSPAMKYADQGFLYQEKDRLRLEIYASGQAALKLTVTPGQVCTGGLCLGKQEFNRRYLSAAYPADTLERILEGREIFGGARVVRSRGGLTQTLKKAGLYDIHYSVLNGSIVFRDKINDILIKIEKRG